MIPKYFFQPWARILRLSRFCPSAWRLRGFGWEEFYPIHLIVVSHPNLLKVGQHTMHPHPHHPVGTNVSRGSSWGIFLPVHISPYEIPSSQLWVFFKRANVSEKRRSGMGRAFWRGSSKRRSDGRERKIAQGSWDNSEGWEFVTCFLPDILITLVRFKA